MSIEYRANAFLKGRTVAALLDGLSAEQSWSVVSRGDRDIVLRWAAHLGNDTLHDAVIEVEDDSVYVAVHAGTRPQRDRLVRLMAQLLDKHGCRVAFVEL